MDDSHRGRFPCPVGFHANAPKQKTIYLSYSYLDNEKEIWWCAQCKEHFVREGNEFHRLLIR